MNTLAILLICLTAVAVVYMMTRPRRRLMYDGVSDYWWPATWNFDWGGGPGRDRYDIMREARPYHGAPHSTPQPHRR